MLASERLRRGNGLDRGDDRKTWIADISLLPVGTVILDEGSRPVLVSGKQLFSFDFGGWRSLGDRPGHEKVVVLTPPTSTKALSHGYVPVLDTSVPVSGVSP
jgi:hypothetical protein